MIDESTICPYTGLRPFTEDESIYFKGRDEHIALATQQLGQNKFIMLTGASGDGKSSLVYAGIVPNAKAGFLKSQFSNWAVADFQPARSPLANLCRSLAKQLGITNESTVRTELGHGFSALVDLYKASPLYIDARNETTGLDAGQLAKQKRGAANLLIIADQFEEFFTNPENFQHGVASQEASLVTNLLLETARIALEEKLPIYVIITMRSDFIGQCASFRGLPEAIGFSQFFVPRLNRSQLREVVEEPAVLSGNKISRRLTERLIHDMVEGTDQLPILQHALNQIWKMADEGRSEMDLLHYAMVGGMNGADLPAEDIARYQDWFRQLPAKIQACYDRPDLQNVLNTHANKLYSFASDYLKNQYQEEINEVDARQIIETTFKCLTKIDNSRAVRNRMTLEEIVNIINLPHLNQQKVGRVLNIFRESGNTLLRPFAEEVVELKNDSVLDITHESLIRNWENLDQWAKDEYASYTVFQDFTQQLNRWVESGRSNAFLLYIGPLTYFEAWFEKAKPTTGWIARYLGEDLDDRQKELRATETLHSATDFLKRSARKHIITRTVVKYGARRMAALLGLLLFIALSSFAVKTYLDHRNSAVLSNIREQSFALLNSPKLRYAEKANFLAEELRLNMITVNQAVEAVKDPIEKIKVSKGLAIALIFQGRMEPAKEIAQTLSITDSLLEHFPIPENNDELLFNYLYEENEWRTPLGLAYYFSPTPRLMELQQRSAKRAARVVLKVLKEQTSKFNDPLDFQVALEHALNFNGFEPAELRKVIETLSPFENKTRSNWLRTNFSEDKIVIRGYQGYGFNFNGLYQNLACLYAAEGKTSSVLQAIDSLLKYNEPYYERNYTQLLDNVTNVASVFYRSHHTDQMDAFVSGYCKRKGMGESEFYQRLLGRARPYQLTRNADYVSFWGESQNLNLQYAEEGEMHFFYEKLREVARRSKNNSETNFLLAMSYKDEGISNAHRSEIVGKKTDSVKITSLYEKSVEHYQKVELAYLNEMIERVGSAASDISLLPRGSLYLFPDLKTAFSPLGARDFHWDYLSASFMEYLIDQRLFQKWYQGTRELEYMEEWLESYQFHVFAKAIFIREQADPRIIYKLAAALEAVQADKKINMNRAYLFAGQNAYEQNDLQLASRYFLKVQQANLGTLFQERVLIDFSSGNSLSLIGTAFTCYAELDRWEDAKGLLHYFTKPANRSSIYAYASMYLMEKRRNEGLAKRLLDSSIVEMNRVENSIAAKPNRNQIAQGIVLLSPTEETVQQARAIIKNNAIKMPGLGRIASSLGYKGELFKATQLAPANISDADMAFLYFFLLRGYADREGLANAWAPYENNTRFPEVNNRILYVDESN